MTIRHFYAIITLIIIFSISYPNQLTADDSDNSRDSISDCSSETSALYHSVFMDRVLRHYPEQKLDSINQIIDRIETECGKSSYTEAFKVLSSIDMGCYNDSLIDSNTISRLLWYRMKRDGFYNPLSQVASHIELHEPASLFIPDNPLIKFDNFLINLAQRLDSKTDIPPSGKALTLLYGRDFDSAFSIIQSEDLQNSTPQNSYISLVHEVKRWYPHRYDMAVFIGGWIPSKGVTVLGNHPDVGLTVGSEWKTWRVGLTCNYRFLSAKDRYIVDSLGFRVRTDKYQSVLAGIELGYKIRDNQKYSTDIFLGLGYDVIWSIQKNEESPTYIYHESITPTFGLRHRFFLNQRNGLYIGGQARYSFADYNNPGGTDLSGNYLTISLIFGWSHHATLEDILNKLNYKGNWRP